VGLEFALAHVDHFGDRAAAAPLEREEGRLAVAARIALRGVGEVAHRVAPAHDPVAFAGGAVGLEKVLVGVVEADRAQKLRHGACFAGALVPLS